MHEHSHLNDLYRLASETLKELETDKGLLASGKDELFGCVFGRDSLISALGILKAYSVTREEPLLALAQKIVSNLCALQGQVHHIETGEEPGKMIHEYREANHEHLTQRENSPWFTAADKTMKNYDTVDATALFLIACYRTYQQGDDDVFLRAALPSVHRALGWIIESSDGNADGFVDYQFHPKRTYGGLRTQGWMDSSEALFHEDGSFPLYPIAPVEAQGYTYLALRLWARYFSAECSDLSLSLHARADFLKRIFNAQFVIRDERGITLASALDGSLRPVTAVRSSMGHVLWASLTPMQDGISDCILESDYISSLVDRLMEPDLFVAGAGIRTLSSLSPMFSLNGYHNGTIWPHDTSMIAEGFENHGFYHEARRVRDALFESYLYFKTPLELFSYDNGHVEYCGRSGQKACRKQAWSAASLLKEVSAYVSAPSL